MEKVLLTLLMMLMLSCAASFACGYLLLHITSQATPVVPDVDAGAGSAPVQDTQKLPVHHLLVPVKLRNHKQHRKYSWLRAGPHSRTGPPQVQLPHRRILTYFCQLMTSMNQSPCLKFGSSSPKCKIVPSGFMQPSLSPLLYDCCDGDMVQKRSSRRCHCVYPIKLQLLVLNVSFDLNWSSRFLEELACLLTVRVSQLQITSFYVVGVSDLNITTDIVPPVGISFSANDVAGMNSSLLVHSVHPHPSFLGNYSVLNFTWFEPSINSPAPSSILAPNLPAFLHPPIPATLPSKKSHSSLVLILTTGAALLVFSIMSVFIICLCASDQGKQAAAANQAIAAKMTSANEVSVYGSLAPPSSTRFIAYEELKEATNSFEPASILGEGGFGQVFKGVLSDGTPVAIKKLTSGGHQGDKEFMVEVEMLSRLHHRNLVKLVGYYTSHDSDHDSAQNLLCYELVPNGSLEAWLHGSLGVNCPLDWDTRMRIALDAARGLAYLHEDCQPCIIHRDFKASNILLQNNFSAKLSDFGLARQAPDGRGVPLSTRVMGTFGYVAPEYAMTGHLIVKSDVYSYGVVLLELLTGRKPVDMSQPVGQENLVSWLVSCRFGPFLEIRNRWKYLQIQDLMANIRRMVFCVYVLLQQLV